MMVTVNGDHCEYANDLTVDALVQQRGGRHPHVAVAVNSTVVPRGAWPSTPLHDGDAVELLSAVAGG